MTTQRILDDSVVAVCDNENGSFKKCPTTYGHKININRTTREWKCFAMETVCKMDSQYICVVKLLSKMAMGVNERRSHQFSSIRAIVECLIVNRLS